MRMAQNICLFGALYERNVHSALREKSQEQALRGNWGAGKKKCVGSALESRDCVASYAERGRYNYEKNVAPHICRKPGRWEEEVCIQRPERRVRSKLYEGIGAL